MGKQDSAQPGVREFARELGRVAVGEVSATASDPLLDPPGIGSRPKTVFIVVRFHDEKGALPERRADGCRRSPEVRRNPHPQARGSVQNRDGDGFRGVVRGGGGLDREVADLESRARQVVASLLPAQERSAGAAGRRVHRETPAPAACSDAGARGVIPVLVRDDDEVDGFRFHIEFGESAGKLNPGEPRIDEHAGAVALDEESVAAAPRAQRRDGQAHERRASSQTSPSQFRSSGVPSSPRRSTTRTAVERKSPRR